MLEDPYEKCKYCGGSIDTHMIDCPHLTNVYPVIKDDCDDEIVCQICDDQLPEGSVYTIVPENSSLLLSCLGCAAMESVMGETLS